MLHGFEDLSDDDLIRIDTNFVDAFDLNAGKGKEIRQLRRGAAAEVEVGAEPGEGNFHENCVRKRVSFSMR